MDDEERPDGMADLVTVLEERFEYVITMMRTEEAPVHEVSKQAFAFIIGRDEGNCIVVEGNVTGDGAQAQTTIYAFQGGEPKELQSLELGGQILHSLDI